jgi:glutaredoxin 3
MSGPQVVVYSTGFCGWCERTKSLLKSMNIPFREARVDDDPALREEMTTRSGQRSVPQVFIGDRHVGGFEALYALHRSGELDTLWKSS